ncbi:MAG: 5-formyltetrahydrofolate cyclo-ligase [Clostridia bacterium]|nr:5-formyltetrahydrofolate cyclo-ligase [Clostridia bacterium]
MSDISEIKKKLRKKLSDLRNGLSLEYRETADNLLFDRVVNSEAYLKSNVVLAYYPVKSEPQILPIVCRAFEDGKKVAFPVSNTNDFNLTFRYINGISELQEGAYSIPEPPLTSPVYKGEGDALCIVPALSFDLRGRRMGYGKGFYDRFLSDFQGIAMGVCYSKLLTQELPYESFDKSVDIIITEKGEITINAE